MSKMQGNSLAVITAGQGGAGYTLTNNEAIIADVDRFDDTEISIVEDIVKLVFVKDELRGEHNSLELYDAVVRLANDEGEVRYILYDNNEQPTDITLTKGCYGHDLLEWSYMGKQYQCEGEFYVDESNNLHHTFIATTGKEMEITTSYND